MSQVFSIETAQDVCFVVFYFLFFFQQKIHPRQLTIHIFHFGCFFPPMPESCFQYFLLPCYCKPPSVLVTPSSISDTRTTPMSLTSAVFISCRFLFNSSFEFLCPHFLLIPSPCMLSAPALSYESLTSICSLLILTFFLLC